METLLAPGLSIDSVDKLFFYPEISKPDFLPILGSSAIEQILSPTTSESSSSCCSSSSGFGEMERMSPDSTMDPIIGGDMTGGFNNGSSDHHHHLKHPADSTTHDLSSYDSDAFDSEDSVSSFAEAQEMAASRSANTANAANAALLWPKQLQDISDLDRRNRRSVSSSSSSKAAALLITKKKKCDRSVE